MPNPTPLPSTLAAQTAAIGPYYGFVYLALAAAAYTDAANNCQSSVVNDITNLIQTPSSFAPLPAAGQELPTTESNTVGLQGSWQITWVPQFSETNYANLMFAATFYDAQLQPVIMAVSIRGTDVFAGGMGVIQQLKQDLIAGYLNNWTRITGFAPQDLLRTLPGDYDLSEPKIAAGSYTGLYDLMQFQAQYMIQSGCMSDVGVTLNIGDYVSQFSAAWPTCPIIVTGHSLGGCQATVLSAYLKSQYPAALIAPNPFAPPTAGNGLFAQTWANYFSPQGSLQANVWINPDDLVPFAYEKVGQMDGLWGSYSWPTNPLNTDRGPSASALQTDLITFLVDFSKLDGDDHYTQLPVNADIMLTGQMPIWSSVLEPFMAANKLGTTAPYSDLWLGMMEWQHFPPCYYSLMTAYLSSTLVYFAPCKNVQCGN